MNTTLLRLALLDASISQLEEVIDWVERPWAPTRNDSLRAAWHETKRSDGAKRALAYAIEEEVRGLSAERDLAHVAQKLGLSTRTADAIASEIVRRLGGIATWPLPVSPDLVVSALRATADLARIVLGESRGGSRHGRRHHGRYRHGR